jgi:hypothetical protein
MKQLFLIVLTSLLFIGCTKDNGDFDIMKDGMIINVEEGLKKATDRNGCNKSELPWLKEILIKAEEDRTTRRHRGSYVGIISMIKHKGQTLIWTNFMFRTGGGLEYVLYNCDGQDVFVPWPESKGFSNQAHKKKNIIYATALQ